MDKYIRDMLKPVDQYVGCQYTIFGIELPDLSFDWTAIRADISQA